jgi:hypothetical protein
MLKIAKKKRGKEEMIDACLLSGFPSSLSTCRLGSSRPCSEKSKIKQGVQHVSRSEKYNTYEQELVFVI